MISKSINFDGYLSLSLGQNGITKCSGVSVNQYDSLLDTERPFIEIRPITSRNKPASCFIRIPLSHIRELNNTLTEIETEYIDKENEGD